MKFCTDTKSALQKIQNEDFLELQDFLTFDIQPVSVNELEIAYKVSASRLSPWFDESKARAYLDHSFNLSADWAVLEKFKLTFAAKMSKENVPNDLIFDLQEKLIKLADGTGNVSAIANYNLALILYHGMLKEDTGELYINIKDAWYYLSQAIIKAESGSPIHIQALEESILLSLKNRDVLSTEEIIALILKLKRHDEVKSQGLYLKLLVLEMKANAEGFFVRESAHSQLQINTAINAMERIICREH